METLLNEFYITIQLQIKGQGQIELQGQVTPEFSWE